MNALPQNTKRRLQKIPQNSSVWEGDRRPLGAISDHFETEAGLDGECVIWVDGTEGTVRAMEIISTQMGFEAVVRTLLRAIESPIIPRRQFVLRRSLYAIASCNSFCGELYKDWI